MSGAGSVEGGNKKKGATQAGVPEDLLKSVSRSFYLSLRFLPEPVREVLGLAYLLARASDTVADASSSGKATRLEALDAFAEALGTTGGEGGDEDQSWERVDGRGADKTLQEHVVAVFSQLRVQHPGETRLLREIRHVMGVFHGMPPLLQQEMRKVLGTILRAQRGDLVRFGYASAECPQSLQTASELEAYAYAVAGCVGEFWTRICVLQMPGCSLMEEQVLLNLGRRFGQGLQLVNILRDLPEDLRAGRCYLPAEELRMQGLGPGDLLSTPERARPIFERWCERAQEWLGAGEAYVRGIRGVRLRFSVSLPRRLGVATLEMLRRNPPLQSTARVRVGRATVLGCALAALREAASAGVGRGE